MIAVVSVHGLWMRGASMAVLRRRLEAHGFGFHDFSYSSVTASLATNAAALAQFIERVPGDTVHLVGHSLGGVLDALRGAGFEHRAREHAAETVADEVHGIARSALDELRKRRRVGRQ